MKPKHFIGMNFRLNRHWALGLFIVLVFALPASAEFYRYVDPHGNVLYTDDLSKVPADQRESVKPYEESKVPPPSAAPEAAESSEAEPDNAVVDELDKERQRLQEQEKALNQEYEELMKMRSRLNEEKGAAVTNAQIKAYNQQIIDFNQRIQAYEAKRDALANEVKNFNRKVEEHSKQGEPK